MKFLKIFCIAALLWVAVAGISNAHAADFQFVGVNQPPCEKIRGESICISLSMTGKIEAGDSAKFLKAVEFFESTLSKKISAARVGLLFLNSPGGDVAESMKVGRLIRERQITTQVVSEDTCASACVLTFAGGVRRIPAGAIVIHSFYSPEILGTNDFSRAEKMYTTVSNEISAYLKHVKVSSLLLDEMIRIPHFSSRQLEIEELSKLGLLGMDPVYAQTRSSTSVIPSPSNKK